jgi:uncharacterized membrane protein YeiB
VRSSLSPTRHRILQHVPQRVRVALVVAGLYFAREFLLPLALGMGRIVSVITAAGLAFGVIGLIGYLVRGR